MKVSGQSKKFRESAPIEMTEKDDKNWYSEMLGNIGQHWQMSETNIHDYHLTLANMKIWFVLHKNESLTCRYKWNAQKERF